MAAELSDPVKMSGGPVEEDQEGKGWSPGAEKEFTVDGRVHIYRRLADDPDSGISSQQAVYVGKKKLA